MESDLRGFLTFKTRTFHKSNLLTFYDFIRGNFQRNVITPFLGLIAVWKLLAT